MLKFDCMPSPYNVQLLQSSSSHSRGCVSDTSLLLRQRAYYLLAICYLRSQETSPAHARWVHSLHNQLDTHEKS